MSLSPLELRQMQLDVLGAVPESAGGLAPTPGVMTPPDWQNKLPPMYQPELQDAVLAPRVSVGDARMLERSPQPDIVPANPYVPGNPELGDVGARPQVEIGNARMLERSPQPDAVPPNPYQSDALAAATGSASDIGKDTSRQEPAITGYEFGLGSPGNPKLTGIEMADNPARWADAQPARASAPAQAAQAPAAVKPEPAGGGGGADPRWLRTLLSTLPGAFGAIASAANAGTSVQTSGAAAEGTRTHAGHLRSAINADDSLRRAEDSAAANAKRDAANLAERKAERTARLDAQKLYQEGMLSNSTEQTRLLRDKFNAEQNKQPSPLDAARIRLAEAKAREADASATKKLRRGGGAGGKSRLDGPAVLTALEKQYGGADKVPPTVRAAVETAIASGDEKAVRQELGRLAPALKPQNANATAGSASKLADMQATEDTLNTIERSLNDWATKNGRSDADRLPGEETILSNPVTKLKRWKGEAGLSTDEGYAGGGLNSDEAVLRAQTKALAGQIFRATQGNSANLRQEFDRALGVIEGNQTVGGQKQALRMLRDLLARAKAEQTSAAAQDQAALNAGAYQGDVGEPL